MRSILYMYLNLIAWLKSFSNEKDERKKIENENAFTNVRTCICELDSMVKKLEVACTRFFN